MHQQNKKATFLDKISYAAALGAVGAISMLPFRGVYLLSDLTAGVLHSVVRYRRKVVRKNLAECFPEKSEKELRKIERQFYKFLCDYAFETAKLLTMTPATIRKRMKVENADDVSRELDAGKNVTLLLGHYCNWEWVSSLPIHFPPEAMCAQVYHTLHNHAFDKLFIRLRTRFDAHNIPMPDIMRTLIGWKREGKVSVTGLIADQEPKGLEIHRYLDFLGHDTGVFTGPERIARFLDSTVYYCHLERPKRGHYTLRFEKITDTPKKEPTFSITDRYFEILERDIRRTPQYWLWSHKRWKRSRKMFEEHWGDKAAEMLSHL